MCLPQSTRRLSRRGRSRSRPFCFLQVRIAEPSPRRHQPMTSQGTAHGRFQRAIHRRHVQAAEMAAHEMGGLSLADALLLCELLAKADPARYERAALRWLQGSLTSGCHHSPRLRSLRRPSLSFGTTTEILVFRR